MSHPILIPHKAPVCQGLQWSGKTDCGPVRENNEDSFLGLQFDARELHHLGAIGEGKLGHADYAFAVSDGMGGANSGEYASRIVVEKITTLLPKSYLQSATGLNGDAPDVLIELFAETHAALSYLGSSDEEISGMEATLSLCWFTPLRMHFAHIGDSRIYYMRARDQTLRQITHDDTHVGWLLRTGKITEQEARNHPRRNILQKALGGGNQFVEPQIGAVIYEPGDVFLLCTDGLFEGLDRPQLEELLRLPELARAEARAADRLVKESLARSGRDNTTALVIRIW